MFLESVSLSEITTLLCKVHIGLFDRVIERMILTICLFVLKNMWNLYHLKYGILHVVIGWNIRPFHHVHTHVREPLVL